MIKVIMLIYFILTGICTGRIGFSDIKEYFDQDIVVEEITLEHVAGSLDEVEDTTEQETTTQEVIEPTVETTTEIQTTPASKPEEETTTLPPVIMETKSAKIEFACIMQNPELPTGCEITSLTMVLNHLGIAAEKCDMADNWLPKGEIGKVHPNDYFLGNPRSDRSYGCYAPVIVNTANTYLQAVGRTDLGVYNLTGSRFEDILLEIDKGNPVIIWATIGMAEPRYTTTWNLNGQKFTWKANEHCLVLTGYDTAANKVYVADPLKGNITYSLTTFKDRFEKMYSQAVVIR